MVNTSFNYGVFTNKNEIIEIIYMEKIIENATIYYKSGSKEIYDAISIVEKGVYTGEIKSIEKDEKFIQKKFVPIDQIQKIIFFNNGKLMKLI